MCGGCHIIFFKSNVAMAHPIVAEVWGITIEIKYGRKFEYILLQYNSELYMTATELTERGVWGEKASLVLFGRKLQKTDTV